ncbi:hypothetical protein K4K59_000749 [Colletotrichum sp. SAR11_240]|nr:hypothetical protein K4K59_000749 [Colletotrichum sp. SAR11_240]
MPDTSADFVLARLADSSISDHSDEEGEDGPVFVIPLWPGLRAVMLPLKVGNAYHFDTRGDLTLKVGGKRSAYDFLVCSRTLGRSSPVFQAMLFGGFAESKPADGSAWNVQLPDDDPSPLLLVLSIIHGHFHHVVRELKEYQLHELLVVTEKYDMTKILYPWASSWFAPYKERSLINDQASFSLVWSSWELGHKEAFCRFARGIMLQQPIDVKGELVTDEITLSRLSDSPFLQPPGFLGLGLKDVAFLETPAPECLLSVNKLSTEILAMTIDLPEEHKECDPLPALKDEVQKLVDCVPAPITDAHIIYLDNQAKKTGI